MDDSLWFIRLIGWCELERRPKRGGWKLAAALEKRRAGQTNCATQLVVASESGENSTLNLVLGEARTIWWEFRWLVLRPSDCC